MAGQATLSQVQALYVAYYGRPAEPAGLNFWANVVEANGGDMSVIIKDFSNAPEYQQRFGSLNDTTLVNNLYLQMFGRSAEPGGLEFWVGLLKAGTQTLGDIAHTISSLASGIDLQVLSGRVDLANAFTTKLAASPEALANYGTERGIEIGRAYLDQVKDATVGSLPALIDKAADTVATLPPAEGGGTGGGGVTPPPIIVFAIEIKAGALSFTGPATGDITITETASEVIFERAGVSAYVKKTDFSTLSEIKAGSATLNVPATLLLGEKVSGNGLINVSAVDANTDFSVFNASQVVKATVNGSLTTAELAAIADAIPNGSVIATNIHDDVANLVSGGIPSSYVTAGVNIIVDTAATVSQIKILDDTNGTGGLKYELLDSVANVALNPEISARAVSITLTNGLNVGDITVAQAHALMKLTNLTDQNGSVDPNDLIYSIKDTPANLISAPTDSVLSHATSITAEPAASVSQAVELIKLAALPPTLAYAVHDSAANLATTNAVSTNALHGASELTATNSASAAQAQSIHVNAASVLAHYSVSDTYNNIVNGAYADGINAAYDLSANTANLSTAQAGDIVAFNNGGLTTIYSVQDSAANVNSFVSGNAWNTTLHYSFSVVDSASNIVDQINNNQLLFITGNPVDITADHTVTSISVNGSFNLTSAEVFWKAVDPVFVSVNKTTADKTTYSIVDTIANYITDENPNGNSAKLSTWVTDADSKTVNGSAADIYQAQQVGRLIFGNLDSSDHIVTTGSAGQQLLEGSAGSDTLYGGDDNDTIYGGAGNDYLNGGAGYNYVAGGEGGDIIYAGDTAADTSNASLSTGNVTTVVGGAGADNMFGSANKDVFVYEATTAAALIAETGTNANTRDYITNFSQGDTIQFANSAKVQFLGNGSGNASSVDVGDFGVSIRYDKDLTIGGLNGGAAVTGTKVSIDVADATGRFDNVPDATIILVGQHIDINVVGNTITFGA
jgi:hypothetical protein